jgi:hypothetical protein
MARASSRPHASESIFALDDPSPNRLGFDLERVMRTPYRIDDFQQVYFVIPSLQALLDATLQDFGALYERLARSGDIPIAAVSAWRPGVHARHPGLRGQITSSSAAGGSQLSPTPISSFRPRSTSARCSGVKS